MNWKQTKPYKSILEVVMDKSGMTEDELLNPTSIQPTQIENLSKAANLIVRSIKEKKQIYVVGDYDADGITSSAILYCLFRKLGVKPIIRLPKRMSEGYGIRVNTIKDFKPGLLITIDNGISSYEAIQTAKERGFDVIILDHHLPPDNLPPADIIVDPHINPENNRFVEYCGAGLAYKLTQGLIGDINFLSKMETLAAIGTIADSVPLNGDNRCIVKNGLLSLRRGKNLLFGVQALLDIAEIHTIDETDIGFKIAPMLNAAGRILDDGAMLSFKTLVATNYTEAMSLAKQLQNLNEKRKAVTDAAEEYIENIIETENLTYNKPICVIADDTPEGIIGIIAGKISEKYKVPTFIFSKSSTPDVYKGSGRTYGGYNLMSAIDNARPYLVAAGGHTGAAGVSVTKDNFINMVNAMFEAMADYEPPMIDVIEYDITIPSSEILNCYNEIEKYAPYGNGNPRPVIKVEGITLSPRGGKLTRPMGKHLEHLKLFGNKFSIVYFHKAQEYKEMGQPSNIDVIGTLSQNSFRFSSELQLEAIEIKERSLPHKKPTTLLEALKANGTI